MILCALCIARTVMSFHPFKAHQETSNRVKLNLYGEQSLVGSSMFWLSKTSNPNINFLYFAIRLIAQISPWFRGTS